MEYAYEATDADGTLIQGAVDAPDQMTAMDQIRAAGYVPLRLVPDPAKKAPAKAKPAKAEPAEVAVEEMPVETEPEEVEPDTAELPADPPWANERELPNAPAPSDAPRTLSRVGGLYRFTDPLAAFGLRFGSIALVVSVILLFVKPAFALIPLALLAIGIAIGSAGYQSSNKRMRAWRSGLAAPATIEWVGQDTSYRINGRSPWMVRYEFFIDGEATVGTRKSFNPELTELKRGQKIWIVYLPENPNISAEWPPIL